MAIYSSVPPPSQQPAMNTGTGTGTGTGIDVEAWNASTLAALNISPSPVGPAGTAEAAPAARPRGTGRVSLSIPLDRVDDVRVAKTATAAGGAIGGAGGYRSGQEPQRRDSMKRREALLRGKEGSRRRQRWENDHLLHVPNVQPPLPQDWEVRPTYPVHTVPYYLAPLWDAGVRHRVEELADAKLKKKKQLQQQRTFLAHHQAGLQEASAATIGAEEQRGRVPQELKQKLKRSKGAKTLLMELEGAIRAFVSEYERGGSGGSSRNEGSDAGETEGDSEDEEIVFVGRNGWMSDEMQRSSKESFEKLEMEKERLVFDSLVDDHGGSFGRWLVHSIATYYGLSSRSVTVGNPARREAYVAIKEMRTGGQVSVATSGELPRPLWGII